MKKVTCFFLFAIFIYAETSLAQTLSNITSKVVRTKTDVYVEISYKIKDVPNYGANVNLEISLNAGNSYEVKPSAITGDADGDVGLVMSDGNKLIKWYPIKSYPDTSGEFMCKAKLALAGTHPQTAYLKIKGFEGGTKNWHLNPMPIVMENLKYTSTFQPTAQCAASRGGWESNAATNADFSSPGNIKDFPGYYGHISYQGDPTSDGCSSFLAITRQGSKFEKVWANFTKYFYKEAKATPGVWCKWELQFRCYLDKETNSKNIVTGILDNKDHWMEVDKVTDWDLELVYENTNSDIYSDFFNLKLLKPEFTFYSGGQPIYKFKYLEENDFMDAGWKGTSNGVIEFSGGKILEINEFVKWNGSSFKIDTSKGTIGVDAEGDFFLSGIPEINEEKPGGDWVFYHGNTKLAVTNRADNTGMCFLLLNGFANYGLSSINKLKGISVIIDSVSLVGGLKAKGIKFTATIMVDGWAGGCYDPTKPNAWTKDNKAKIQITDLIIDNVSPYIHFNQVSVRNIGIERIPGFCLKELKMSYDKTKDYVKCDLIELKTPLFNAMSEGGTKLSATYGYYWSQGFIMGLDALGIKLELATPIPGPPTPAGPPAYAWKAFSASGANFNAKSKDPVKICGLVTITDPSGTIPWAKYFSTLFEKDIGGCISFKWPPIIEGDYNARYFKVGWTDNWLVNLAGKLVVNTSPSEGGIQLDGTARIIELGGSKPVVLGTLTLGLSWANEYVIYSKIHGEVNIPDLFKGSWVFQSLNDLFKLPRTLGTLDCEWRNAAILFKYDLSGCGGEPWGCIVDLTKNISDPHFFTLNESDAKLLKSTLKLNGTPVSMININQDKYQPVPLNIPELKKDNKTLGNDTTFVEATATANTKTFFIRVFGVDHFPASILIDPAGKKITGTLTDSSIVFIEGITKKSSFWNVKNPVTGNWKIAVINPLPTDSVSVIEITKPRNDFQPTVTQTEKEITISWDATGCSDSSEVDLFLDSDSQNFDGVHVKTVFEKTGSYKFYLSDSLSNCKYYIYGIRMDRGALSKGYAQNTITNNKTHFAPPFNIKVISDVRGNMKLTWNKSVDSLVAYYEVVATDKMTGLDTTIAFIPSYEDTIEIQLNNHMNKKLMARSVGDGGILGCWSEIIDITTDVEEEYALKRENGNVSINILPNPAKESINIYFDNRESGSVGLYLYNISGLKIHTISEEFLERGNYKMFYNTEKLSSGSYIIRIVTNSGVYSKLFNVIK